MRCSKVFCKNAAPKIFVALQDCVAGFKQQLYQNKTPTKMFSCELCEILQNSF